MSYAWQPSVIWKNQPNYPLLTDPKTTVDTQQIPDDVPNIQNEGGNQENADNGMSSSSNMLFAPYLIDKYCG